jgi:hypothetical protein
MKMTKYIFNDKGYELSRITVCGHQGRWAVYVPDHGDLAIVPTLWRQGDIFWDPMLVPGVSKTDELTRRIRETGLAITADFSVWKKPRRPLWIKGDPLDPDTDWDRDEYDILWRIADFSFDENGLRFRLVEPLADIGKKNKWQEKKKRTRRGRGSY